MAYHIILNINRNRNHININRRAWAQAGQHTPAGHGEAQLQDDGTL